MSSKWVIFPEDKIDWEGGTYKHLNKQDLAYIRAQSVVTGDRCSDPGKTVINRLDLVNLINSNLAAEGLPLDYFEVCPRTLSQFVLAFSRLPGRPRLTISSCSRHKYLLVENGAAAKVCDYVFSNLGMIKGFRKETLKEMKRRAKKRIKVAK